jgi:hypothetical protein
MIYAKGHLLNLRNHVNLVNLVNHVNLVNLVNLLNAYLGGVRSLIMSR